MTEHNKKEESLSASKVDYAASAAKAALGAVPYFGSLFVEIVGTVIPHQRIDRIADFALKLSARISHLEEQQVRSHITDENFTDLMEEGFRQAARSTSVERREHIANVIASGLTSADISFMESKHLLRILGEINDIEVIWLRSYLNPAMNSDVEFRSKHEDILRPVAAHLGSSRSELDKATLNDSYKAHLAQLGLLSDTFEVDRQTKTLQLDRMTGEPKRSGYRITPLGRLLLRQLGLIPE